MCDRPICLILRSVALKSEIRKLNIVHVLIWVLMAAQVMVKLKKTRFLRLTVVKAELVVTLCCLSMFSGDSEPAEPCVPQGRSLSIPVGVPLPPEHNPHSVQLLGVAPQQHQLLGDLHDQRRALLCGPPDLRQHGDVPRGTAALSARQSLPLHLRLLCCVGDVPGDRHRCAGARLADLLQQEAAGPVVHQHAGEEEEMSWTKA